MHWLSFLKKMSYSSIAKVILDNFLKVGNISHTEVCRAEDSFLSVSPGSDGVSFPLYMLILQIINTFYITVVSRTVLLRRH